MEGAVHALAQTLESSPVIHKHPGGVGVGRDLYAQQKGLVSEVAKRFNTYGRLNIGANSLAQGSTVSFQIPPHSFLGPCILNASVVVQAGTFGSSMWLADLINTISYSLGGSSSINNITISGASMRDIILATCHNESKRNKLFPESSVILGAAGEYKASLLLNLPWSSVNLGSVYPYDTGSLNSNITINISFKPFYEVFCAKTGTTPIIPTSFSSLNMKALQTDLINPHLSMGYHLATNPHQEYKMPFHLAQTYTTQVNVVPGAKFEVSLSSLPAGILEAIIVSVRANDTKGINGLTNFVRPESVMLSSYQLLHNGQTIISVDSEQESDAIYNVLMNDGDGCHYRVWNVNALATDSVALAWESRIYVLPLCRDIAASLNDKFFEHTPSYGGSILTFQGVVRHFAGNGVLANPSNANYTLNFTYLFNALIENVRHTTSIVV